MELTEQYMNRCMEDFSDSCRDFLRSSLEEMFRNYESFVADRVSVAKQRYRQLMEGIVHETKQEESLDSLLSDPKHTSRATVDSEYKEEAATTEEEDIEVEGRFLAVYPPMQRRHLDEVEVEEVEEEAEEERQYLTDSVSHADFVELGGPLSMPLRPASLAPDSPLVGSRTARGGSGRGGAESDECDLDASKDEDEDVKPGGMMEELCFKVEEVSARGDDDVEAEVEEEVTEVYPRGLAPAPFSLVRSTNFGAQQLFDDMACASAAGEERRPAPPHLHAQRAAPAGHSIIVEVTQPHAASDGRGLDPGPGRTAAPAAAAGPAAARADEQRRQHQCKVCGRAFTRAFDLRRHHRTHTGERPYVCDVCGRAFTQSFPLKVHKRKHSDVGLHQCGVCRRGFVKESDLVRHMGVHMKSSSSHAADEGAAGGRSKETESVTTVLIGHPVPVEGDIVIQEMKVEEVH